jgi:hypothetical protein
MSTASRIILLTLAITGWVVAKPPVKQPLQSYSSLWNNSPFTSKPVITDGPPPANILDDYALLGVSPISGGYRVTLINKKKPEERLTVDSDRPSKDGFKVLAVTRKSGDPLGTVVRMMSGTVTGTVSFDDKLLTVAAPPAAKPQPHAQPAIPGQPQPQLQPGQMPQRQPRPRVVPPPAPGTQPQPQAQPAQNNTRQDRRGGR